MSKKRFETISVRTQIRKTQEREHSSPLYLTSSFTFDDAEQMRAAFHDEIEANIYSRFSNPNVREFERKMAALEGAEDGFATATGMAAIFAGFISFLNAGDHVLSSAEIFGSTHTILTRYFPKWGIQHSFFSLNKPDEIEKYIRKNTRIIYLETPSNPGLSIIDLEYVGKIAKKYNLIFIVDNCFATPYIQQPILYGADLVVHSATKFIDGQGRVLGGVVVGKKELIKEIYLFCRNTGPSLSPFNAWVLSKSLETLAVRMEKHCSNAMTLAQWLSENKEIESVKYPFLPTHPQYTIAKKQMKAGGGIVTFNVKGGYERAKKFMDALQMLSISANLGDTRTIATHPSSSTHSKLTEEERISVGITSATIRISVGLENVEDIIEDVEQALKKSSKH
jgi:O-succinylhomoserine sulfhydrylase